MVAWCQAMMRREISGFAAATRHQTFAEMESAAASREIEFDAQLGQKRQIRIWGNHQCSIGEDGGPGIGRRGLAADVEVESHRMFPV
ncbi:hypothetical protein L1887_07606 [Cichorium endivia]|nr:hypothetical protein L1887_07606 [Cichorium endivia]